MWSGSHSERIAENYEQKSSQAEYKYFFFFDHENQLDDS